MRPRPQRRRLTTDDGGRFSGYVPAGLPLCVSLVRAPRGYVVRRGPLIDAWSNARPVLAASEETTLPDPVAAARFATDDLDPDQAAGALAMLQKRSAVIERLHFLERLWWVRDAPDTASVED